MNRFESGRTREELAHPYVIDRSYGGIRGWIRQEAAECVFCFIRKAWMYNSATPDLLDGKKTNN